MVIRQLSSHIFDFQLERGMMNRKTSFLFFFYFLLLLLYSKRIWIICQRKWNRTFGKPETSIIWWLLHEKGVNNRTQQGERRDDSFHPFPCNKLNASQLHWIRWIFSKDIYIYIHIRRHDNNKISAENERKRSSMLDHHHHHQFGRVGTITSHFLYALHSASFAIIPISYIWNYCISVFSFPFFFFSAGYI